MYILLYNLNLLIELIYLPYFSNALISAPLDPIYIIKYTSLHNSIFGNNFLFSIKTSIPLASS